MMNKDGMMGIVDEWNNKDNGDNNKNNDNNNE